MIYHVVSCSTGKDSDATLKVALKRCPPGSVIAIICDTGNEHEAVFEHAAYLEKLHGIKIIVLRNDFSDEFPRKRMFIARDQRVGRQYDTELVFDTDGNPVWKRDGRGNIVTHKVKRGGVKVDEPVQKTKKIGGGGVECAGATRQSAGLWRPCIPPGTHSWTFACSRVDFQAGKRSFAPSD